MRKTLTPAEMQQIREDYLAKLNLIALSDEWRWRWLLLGSDAPLTTKLLGILISFFRETPSGYRPSIEQLAAFSGVQPRCVMTHTSSLTEEGFFKRDSGNGAGNTSTYKRAIPEKTIRELATRSGIKVHLGAPLEAEKVHGDAPLKVHEDAPLFEKGCTVEHQRVHPDAPPFKYIKERDSKSAANGLNGHPSRAAGPENGDAGFEAFWGNYRNVMKAAGGKALKNSRNMSKPDARKAWQGLDMFQRDSARRFIGAYARDAGEFMCSAARYLSEHIFQNHADDAADEERTRREHQIELLAKVFAGKSVWSQGMTDFFGGEVGTAGCRIQPDIEAEARARATRMKETADA